MFVAYPITVRKSPDILATEMGFRGARSRVVACHIFRIEQVLVMTELRTDAPSERNRIKRKDTLAKSQDPSGDVHRHHRFARMDHHRTTRGHQHRKAGDSG